MKYYRRYKYKHRLFKRILNTKFIFINNKAVFARTVKLKAEWTFETEEMRELLREILDKGDVI
jgi:ribosome maturation protein Sdo1